MKKRILSLFLALFVLIAALPFGTVMAEDTVVEDTTVSESTDSVAAEITLQEPDFPEKATTYKVANNFPTEANTFRALCTNQASEVPWDPGVTTDASSYASVSGGTTTISNGWATFKEGEEKGTFTTQIVFKTLPDSDTNYIAVDVDASGIVDTTSKMNARLYMGMSSGSNTMYATAGQTYYFLPAATEENPNPEMQTRTMSSSSNNYSATFYVYPGDKGTFYFPETLFLVSDDIANYNNSGAEWVTDGVGDFSKYMADEWRLWHASGKYKSNCMYFQYRSCIPANNSIAFSNVRWMSETAFQLDYNAEYIDEDFSNAETASYTYWNGSNHTMTDANFEVVNGVWKNILTAEDWTDEASAFRYGTTVNLDYPVTTAFEALQFDADYSSLSVQPQLQITYNVKNTNVSKNDYVRRFAVANGDVYAVWENGVVETITVANDELAWLYLPQGFKGTVVIPFETLRTMTLGDYTYDGTTVDLFKNDDINNYGITIDTRNIPFADKGDVITYDNYGYLTTLKPVADEGTTFTTEAPIEVDNRITEEINTIEAWVKVPAGTAEGTILADKYRVANTTATDSIVLKMNASGNPVFYLSDGDGHAVTLEVSDVDLRTDRWTHIAFAKGETAVNCYVNGMLKGSAALPEGFAEVKPYHVLTLGHYIEEELGTAAFGGEVSNLKLWSKALTSSEILSSAINEPANAEGLISAYTLNGDNALTDIADNYNLEVYDLYTTPEDEAYAEYSSLPEGGYTFAVLPDTQIAAQREAVDEVGSYTSFSGMYDWLVANKETQNIKFVMGLGDITNKDAAEEYILAKSNFDKLTAAGIPWSVVGGNHDFNKGNVSPYNTTNLNTYFPANELATLAGFGGFMEADAMDNSYYYVTANDTKYLILNLCCEPTNAAIEWGNQVCAKNKDCKVIVITHEYLNRDAELRTRGYTNRNQGIDIWNKLVSQHENVIMAIGGHVAVPDIQYSEALGVNGNKVVNVLVDPQALDWDNPSYNMIMLLKFSADGSKVNFNLYTPTQDAYFDANNQFTLDVGGVVSDEKLPEAPKADYTYSKYHSGEVIRDYEWLVTDDGKLGIWCDTKYTDAEGNSKTVCSVSTNNFSWYDNMLKFTAPSQYAIKTEATDESEAVYYDSARVGITIDDLPNVVNANHTAISIYVDNSFATDTTGLRLRFNKGGTAYETYSGSIVYIIDENGNIEEYECTGTHASAYVAKGFKGTVIVPFSSFRNASTKEVATAADMLVETQANNAHYVVYVLNATPGASYVFNNVTYLEEYQADDLAALRNGLMKTENGKLIDVTADNVVDARDIVRLKKVLVDYFVK